jgi:hypothetical protein
MRSWILVAALGMGIAGCTRHNPHACTSDGACTDPAFPFCDVRGSLGGDKNECIAVACTPNQFAECRDDTEVRCSADGTNYSVTACERVCESSLGGCRLCDANESACTNSIYATCDANGTVVASIPCALGCFDGTRCKEIVASNGLSAYRDMVSNPPDLDLSGGAKIDTANGMIMGYTEIVPNFLVPAASGGVPIRVFVAGRVRLGNITFGAINGNSDPEPAFAIVATGEISVEGTISLPGDSILYPGQPLTACDPQGAAGFAGIYPNNGPVVMSGAGGGGFGTPGGNGGDYKENGAIVAAGGKGGSVQGTASLVPLRGGCGEGGEINGGGGAIQLSSNDVIRVTGTIDARGKIGKKGTANSTQSTTTHGGGSGGAILLEAKFVEVVGSGRLLANGGSGGSLENDGSRTDDGTAAAGGACSTAACGVGGLAASNDTAASRGGDVEYGTPAGATAYAAGGGGGGLGRIRINTLDGTFSKNGVVIGATTTGTLPVR